MLTAIVWGSELFGIFLAIAIIPLAMQVCTPAVAATQFTIYMAVANFGRPIGAWIAGLLADDSPQTMYFLVAGIMAAAAAGSAIMLRRMPRPGRDMLPAGAIAAPVEP